MLKNRIIKISLISIVIVTILYLLGKYNPISMEFIINQHGQIRNIIDESPLIAVISTVLIIAVLISVMGPITPICILTGFYFGLYIGLTIAIIGETLGAIIVFLYGRYLFKEYFLNLFGTKFDKFKEGFNKNSINYLLLIRVIGGTPFGVQNLLPAILDMRFKDYFIATIFGVIPWAYILVSIGNGIQDIVDAGSFSSDAFLKLEYMMPIFILILIIVSPIIYKYIKKRFSN